MDLTEQTPEKTRCARRVDGGYAVAIATFERDEDRKRRVRWMLIDPLGETIAEKVEDRPHLPHAYDVSAWMTQELAVAA